MKERSTREAFLLTMTTPPQPSNCKALIFTIKHYDSFMIGSLSILCAFQQGQVEFELAIIFYYPHGDLKQPSECN